MDGTMKDITKTVKEKKPKGEYSAPKQSLSRPHDFDENNMKIATSPSPTDSEWHPDKRIQGGDQRAMSVAIGLLKPNKSNKNYNG